MSNLLLSQNYNGTVEYSKEDNCLFGKVVGIKSLLSYEGDSVKELEQDFQEGIRSDVVKGIANSIKRCLALRDNV